MIPQISMDRVLPRMTRMWSARQDELKDKLCSVGAMLDALGNPTGVPQAVLDHCSWDRDIVLPYSYFKINDFIWVLLVCSIFKKKRKSKINKSKGTDTFFISFTFP